MTGVWMLVAGGFLFLCATAAEGEARNAFVLFGIWAALGGACYLV